MSEIPADGLRVVPLGGLGKIGRNMMVVETADDLVVIDAGVMFPSEEMLGVDLIIPDVSYIAARRKKLRAYLITHGHEDHIGALPYILKDLPAPIYATRLAQGLIEGKLRERGLDGYERVVVTPDSILDCGSIQVEFFAVAHSIPDAVGMALRTPAGLMIHTGDFKIDHTPVMSEPTDLPRLAHYGEEGVRLLCSDSTYADQPGHTPSEQVVGVALEEIMLAAPGRVIIATFASQIARVQQIIDGAEVAGRTVCVTGRSMVQNVRMARELAYVKAAPGAVREIREHASFADEDVVIICTGSQGEPMSALSRMSTGDYRDVDDQARRHRGALLFADPGQRSGSEPDDRQPLSGRGGGALRGRRCEERPRARPRRAGGIEDGAGPDAAGHIRPRSRRVSPPCAPCAAGRGERRDASGLPLVAGRRHPAVDAGDGDHGGGGARPPTCMWDGMTVGGVDHTVLRDRRHLASDGVVVVVVAIDQRTGQIVGEPDVVPRGFVDMDESPELRARTVACLQKALGRGDHPVEWPALQEKLKREISGFLYRETRQRPMVLPVAVKV